MKINFPLPNTSGDEQTNQPDDEVMSNENREEIIRRILDEINTRVSRSIKGDRLSEINKLSNAYGALASNLADLPENPSPAMVRSAFVKIVDSLSDATISIELPLMEVVVVVTILSQLVEAAANLKTALFMSKTFRNEMSDQDLIKMYELMHLINATEKLVSASTLKLMDENAKLEGDGEQHTQLDTYIQRHH